MASRTITLELFDPRDVLPPAKERVLILIAWGFVSAVYLPDDEAFDGAMSGYCPLSLVSWWAYEPPWPDGEGAGG